VKDFPCRVTFILPHHVSSPPKSIKLNKFPNICSPQSAHISEILPLLQHQLSSTGPNIYPTITHKWYCTLTKFKRKYGIWSNYMSIFVLYAQNRIRKHSEYPPVVIPKSVTTAKMARKDGDTIK
jgi:hypothetical protein